MRKVLITGASGFIGTNLINCLLGTGSEVLNLDIKEPQNSRHQHGKPPRQ